MLKLNMSIAQQSKVQTTGSMISSQDVKYLYWGYNDTMVRTYTEDFLPDMSNVSKLVSK